MSYVYVVIFYLLGSIYAIFMWIIDEAVFASRNLFATNAINIDVLLSLSTRL